MKLLEFLFSISMFIVLFILLCVAMVVGSIFVGFIVEITKYIHY